MRNFRIIPRLDIKQGVLIKGIQMEGWRKVGPPNHFARKYYEDGADELILMDVVASLYGRNNLAELVKEVAENVFIPLTVGGGIRNTDDAFRMFEVGADKISINTSAITSPAFIEELSSVFGSQAIVVSIETGIVDGKYQVLTENGRNRTNIEPVAWAKECEERGAGEIILTSIPHEGMGNGLNNLLISEVCNTVTVPVLAGGGYGNSEHVNEVIQSTEASGMVTARALHFEETSIPEIKSQITSNQIYVR